MFKGGTNIFKNVNGIAIKGRYFDSETRLDFFEKQNNRMSLIYGKNGSGKSTIADAFNAYKDEKTNGFDKVELYGTNGVPIELTNEARQNIFVFDEKYIDDKILFREEGLNTIVMFGEQIKLDEQIKKLEVEIEKLNKGAEQQSEVCGKYYETKNSHSPEFHYELIKDTLRNGGWAEKDSKIKGFKTKTGVTDNVIKEIMQCTSADSKNELEAEFGAKSSLYENISKNQEEYKVEIKAIAIPENYEEKLIATLAKTIEQPELTEREHRIMNVVMEGSQTLVEEAQKSFLSPERDHCPYCFQPVSEEYKANIVKSIDKVLNKDVDEHKRELEDLIQDKIQFEVNDYLGLDNNLTDKIKVKIKSCNDTINKYNEFIARKISNAYVPIELTSLKLSDLIRILNSELEELENLRISFNKSIEQKDIIKNELIVLNKQIARHQILKLYEQYEKQKEEKQDEEKKYSDIKQGLKTKGILKDDLNQQKKNVKIASEYINKALEYVFYCEGRLTVEVKEDVYYIKSSGHPVKTSEISSGERNIIALCYFFTQILREQADKEAYKKEYLLIIDDPVSSFDFENKVGIQSFLKSQASKILSGNQNSRIVWMSHDLSTIYALHKVSEEMKKHLKTGAAIHNVLELENKKLISLDVRKRNEYTHLMENIYRYATKENENDLIIGNVMRRALEAFSTFEFKKGFVELSCDRDLLSTLGDRYVDYFENFMYRLVLHGESHYEEKIKTLPDMNFFGFISAEEKVRTAKDVLCLMYLFNKNHVEAHLLGIDGATDNIENWCESITEM